MKIALFTFRAYPAKGGVEYHVKMISEYLASKNNKVTVYTSRMENPDEITNLDFSFPFYHAPKKASKLKHSERVNGVNYSRYDMKFRFYSYNMMEKLYSDFRRVVKNFDIVHLNSLNLYNNVVLAQIAKDNDVPVVLSCYDISIPENLPFQAKMLKSFYDSVLLKKLEKNVEKFFLLTSDQIPELSKIGIPKDKIMVWNAGFDIRKIRDMKESHILQAYNLVGKKYFFNMGRIEEYKGIQDIVKIAKDFPSVNFVISGRDYGYLDTLKGMVVKLKLRNVIFTGEITDSDAKTLLKNAYAFIFPSRKEGFGIVLAEAMSLGVPFISYPIQNVRAAFTDEGGIFVKNINDMKTTVALLIKNYSIRKKLSKSAFKEAEKYDYRSTLPVLMKIYKEVLR